MKALNAALGVVLAATIGAHVFLNPARDVPNRDYLPEMVYSRAAESYAASAVLRGGRVLQTTPAGTISRQASLISYEATPAEALRAGRELTAPGAAPGDEARGAVVFSTFCTVCHGSAGLGNGSVTSRGFPPPPSLLSPHALALPDGQIFHIVTYGQLNMPGYAAQIDEADRWRVVAHVRQLQRSSR